MKTWLLALLVGCAHDTDGALLPADAGLPASPTALAVSTLAPLELPEAHDVDGATVVPIALAENVWVYIATDPATPTAHAAIWARQVERALVDVHVQVVIESAWVRFAVASEALPALLGALQAPALSDDALSDAFITRPDAQGPVSLEGVRGLHRSLMHRGRVLITGDVHPADVAGLLVSWPDDGVPTEDWPWRDQRAHETVAAIDAEIQAWGGSRNLADARTLASARFSRQTRLADGIAELAALRWRTDEDDVASRYAKALSDTTDADVRVIRASLVQ